MTRFMRSIAVLILAVIALTVAAIARGQESQPQETDDFTTRYFQMLGGMAVGFLAHEAAHYAAGAGKTQFHNDTTPVPNWSCEGCGRDHTRFVSLAGFMEQIISTEIIFRSGALPRRGPSFLHGFVLFNIILPVGYVYANEVSDAISGEGMGDLKAFNRSERRAIEASLLAWSAMSAYRWYALAERRQLPSFFLFVTPIPHGGITVTYSQRF
ncbi:MAG: hypothetical protein HYY60_02835 [Parcubacteria group bacterium]|nr:hypothetical protein [Parcubacteria group bacterium]MBI3074713.1 hypothetical protein [Parcubacteria group bacterium]